MVNTYSPRGNETENSNHEATNKPVERIEMYLHPQTTGGYSKRW